MSQEDARGLGKTTDFMRAVSILFLVMNVYYFCYPFFHRLGCTNGMADRILLNLQRDTGLFTHSLVTKSFCLMFLLFSAMGARGRREMEMSRLRIGCVLICGLSFYFSSELLLTSPWDIRLVTLLYVSAVTSGYICLLTAGMWAGRLLGSRLMDDVFNEENESFMQETRLMTNEYSVNLPTRFHYNRKWHDG